MTTVRPARFGRGLAMLGAALLMIVADCVGLSDPSPVVVHLTSEPSGATVLVGSHRLGVTPCDKRFWASARREPVRFRFEADGFDSTVVTVQLRADRTEVHGYLDRAGAAP